MKLTPNEFHDMQLLLGKTQVGQNLTPQEEMRLRSYIRKEQPESADDPLDAIIKVGLVVVGIYLLYKAFQSLSEA
ncbi:hypothetical protein R6Y95_03290 [Methanoculleus palmolei]|jgi:hypothetical protein|uniref:Uncharacterized protein n=1 Tax=Methanoculleus palmolei TaxID=72612 RepID=A0ABD8ABB6_9EURY|nr:hypothetical protein [Methanoculleus sp. UBA377]WOX56368.1 hypothetical protein R6Y95_03290 [Methanoculleus palmolei]